MARRIALFLLGAWLSGVVIVAAMAVANFRMVDRLLQPGSSDPAFQQALSRLPEADARLALRHLASELNRIWFERFGWAELALGSALLLLILTARSGKPATIAVSAMLAITGAMAFYITPQIVEIGRLIEFVPRDPPPPEFASAIARFGWLHGAYSGLDLIKLGLGLWVAVLLIRERTS